MQTGSGVPSTLIVARATVNLKNLYCGERAWVDPARPKIAELLAAGYLVAEDDDR